MDQDTTPLVEALADLDPAVHHVYTAGQPVEPHTRHVHVSTPNAQCPSCGAWVEDLDGFGVLIHEACGYCAHPDIYGDVCRTCGERLE